MTINLSNKYMNMLQKMIDMGLAESLDEAVRQSIIAYNAKLENEEFFLVENAVKKEMKDIKSNKTRLFDADDVFSDAGI